MHRESIAVGDAVDKSAAAAAVAVVVVAEVDIMTKAAVAVVDIMAKINSKAGDQGNNWGNTKRYGRRRRGTFPFADNLGIGECTVRV